MNPRSPERIRHHYEVERELAEKMRASTREQRTELFKTLYTELFERVPDHPRVVRRVTPEDSQRKVEGQLQLLRPFLTPETTLVEIASGDCQLSYAAAKLANKVIGVDISDQRALGQPVPDNFELIVYDGYNLDAVADGVADVVFSYQFLEHLHPDDLAPHFELVARMLRPGGRYVFDTPHRFSGPHDVSRFFGDTLDCFHFQEWTHREMDQWVKKAGFSTGHTYVRGKIYDGWLANSLLRGVERLLGLLPRGLQKSVSQRVFQSVTMAVVKQ